MTEGEFHTRLIKAAESEKIGRVWISDVKQIVEEAKRDFPLDKEVIHALTNLHTVDRGKLPLVFTVDLLEFIEWFVRWFGT